MSKKPTPKKQQAKSSTRSRHSKYVAEQRRKLEEKYALDTCPETGEAKLRHCASPSGKYRGRQVFDVKTGGTVIQEIKA